MGKFYHNHNQSWKRNIRLFITTLFNIIIILISINSRYSFSNNKNNKNAIIVLVRADIIEFDVDEYDSNYETLDSLPPSFPTSEPSNAPPTKAEYVETASSKIEIVTTKETTNNVVTTVITKATRLIIFIGILCFILYLHMNNMQFHKEKKEKKFEKGIENAFTANVKYNDKIKAIKTLLEPEIIPKKYHNTSLLQDGLYLLNILKQCKYVDDTLISINNINNDVKQEQDCNEAKIAILNDSNILHNECKNMYETLKNNNKTNTKTIITSYYTHYSNEFIQKYEDIKSMKNILENYIINNNRKDDEQKVDGDVMYLNSSDNNNNNAMTAIVGSPMIHTNINNSNTAITLNSPSVEEMKSQMKLAFPLIKAEKIESMVADKMLDYKMKQKLEMDRQKFEINKTIAIEQKKDERHKENKKEKEKANEKAFKLKEQEIKLNERQHKENLDQQKNIANNQARQKQQEFDQKEMEKQEKLKYEYMYMSLTLGVWIFCIVLCMKFRLSLIEKFNGEAASNSIFETMFYNVMPTWFSVEYFELLLCFLGSALLMVYSNMLFAMLPPMGLVYSWFGEDIYDILERGKGYALWYILLVVFCYQMIPYIFFSSRGWDVHIFGVDILPFLIKLFFPFVFVCVAYYCSLNIICGAEDTTCRDMIWENVWNVVAFIIGDLF